MKSTTTTESLRPLLTIKADEAGALPDKIEVLQTGMWDAPYHGMFMVTPEDLQQYIQNYQADVRPQSSTKGLPIDLDHDKGAAAGWMTGLSALPNDQGGWSLWADVSWTDMGKEVLLSGQYAFFSPEFCPEGYVDPEGELEPLTNVLVGGGLTNRPLFKDLQPVMANDASGKSSGLKSQFNKMFISASAKEEVVPSIDEVRIKLASDLTTEDKEVIVASKDELSPEEREKFSEVLADAGSDASKKADDDATAAKVAADAAAAAAAEKTNTEGATVTANDKGQVTISASELADLKAAANQGVSAHEKLVRKEAEEHVNSKVYSASDGYKFQKDLKDELVELYHTANDAQKVILDKMFDATTPIMAADQMAAQGTGQGEFSSDTAAAELTKKANEIITASDNKTSFSDALLQARRENPELVAAADQSYEANKPKVTVKA